MVSNKRVAELANINSMSCELRKRRWNWLGHVFRRREENDCITALGKRPEGQRARGRLKTTWRTTVEKERDQAGWTSWSMARTAAQNRVDWTDVTALCAFWHDER